jgi:hypothetical protein
VTRLSAYNPGALQRDDLVEGFVARGALLDRIKQDLRKPKPRHRLFVGPRGMGKTTLLRRVYFAALEDTKIAASWIPLAFREEQYNIVTLADLWLNCLDSLADALEEQGMSTESATLDTTIERLRELGQDRIERETLSAIDEEAEKRRRGFLLLVDNVDLMFERLSKDEQWKLREALSNHRLLLFGSSVTSHSATYEYNAPFYEFFAQESLRGLDDAEVSEVLVLLSERRNTPEVARIVREEPARIRTLRALSGGNPRAIVLVHQVLTSHDRQSVVDDVESLMDMSTPLYKARFETLSKQAQIIVDAMATAWDPVTAARVAKLTRLDVNVVSSQLSRLADDGVVEKVKYPGAKAGFQIAERMFNIWYLMRSSRRTRQKLIWLVEFLGFMYGKRGMAEYARELASNAKTDVDAQLLLAYASKLEKQEARFFECRAIEAIISNASEIQRTLAEMFDLEGDDRDLRDLAARVAAVEEVRRTLRKFPTIEAGTQAADDVLSIAMVPLQTRLAIAKSLAKKGPQSVLRVRIRELSVSSRRAYSGHFEELFEAAKRGLIGSIEKLSAEELRTLKSVQPRAFDQAFAWICLESSLDELRTLGVLLADSNDVISWHQWLLAALEKGDLTAVIEVLKWAASKRRKESFWLHLTSFLMDRWSPGAFWAADWGMRDVSTQANRSAGALFERLWLSLTLGDGRIEGLEGLRVAPIASMRLMPWPDVVDAVRRVAPLQPRELTWFARAAAQCGQAGSAADLLDELGAGDQYRPIRDALRACALGPENLLTVSPEVREHATKIYEWISFRKEDFTDGISTRKNAQSIEVGAAKRMHLTSHAKPNRTRPSRARATTHKISSRKKKA